jgi:hypothetical protein
MYSQGRHSFRETKFLLQGSTAEKCRMIEALID